MDGYSCTIVRASSRQLVCCGLRSLRIRFAGQDASALIGNWERAFGEKPVLQIRSRTCAGFQKRELDPCNGHGWRAAFLDSRAGAGLTSTGSHAKHINLVRSGILFCAARSIHIRLLCRNLQFSWTSPVKRHLPRFETISRAKLRLCSSLNDLTTTVTN